MKSLRKSAILSPSVALCKASGSCLRFPQLSHSKNRFVGPEDPKQKVRTCKMLLFHLTCCKIEARRPKSIGIHCISDFYDFPIAFPYPFVVFFFSSHSFPIPGMSKTSHFCQHLPLATISTFNQLFRPTVVDCWSTFGGNFKSTFLANFIQLSANFPANFR